MHSQTRQHKGQASSHGALLHPSPAPVLSPLSSPGLSQSPPVVPPSRASPLSASEPSQVAKSPTPELSPPRQKQATAVTPVSKVVPPAARLKLVLTRTAKHLDRPSLHDLKFTGIPSRLAGKVLEAFYRAQHGGNLGPFAGVHGSILERFQYNYIPSLSQLTISGMPTNLHNALLDFSTELFRQLDPHQQRIFTAGELKKIRLRTANVSIPGVTRRRATASATRTIQSAYEKISDFALNYNYQAFPQVVFEVGWATEKKHAAKYAEGIEDATDWLVATKGKISVVWLIQIIEGSVVGSFATAVERLICSEEVSLGREPYKEAEDGIAPESDDSMDLSDSEKSPDNSIDTIGTEETSQWPGTDRDNTSGAGTYSEPGDSDSSTASSTASSYSTIYETMAPILSNWIGPLTVFLEGYSYDPTTDSGICCSHPRVYLLRNNIPENPLPTLPLSRDHFGMSECQDKGYGEVFQVGLEDYVRLLQEGRVTDGYARKVKIMRKRREKKRKMRKRKMSGDDPADGDWLPHRAEGRVEGEEEASTNGKVRGKVGVKGKEVGFKRCKVE